MSKIILPTPIDEKPPAHQRISWWFENTIIRGLKRFLNDGRDTLKDILRVGVGDIIEDTEADLIELIRPFANEILSIPDIPQYIKEPIEQAMLGKKQGGLAVVVGLVLVLFVTFREHIIGPLGRQIEQQVERTIRSTLFDPATLIALHHRNLITTDQLQKFMAMNGVSNEGITALKQLAIPLFDDASLSQLMFRGLASDGEVKSTLSSQGYTPEQISKWIALREVIPSPTDLVSMAVREAFNDETAAAFGYDDDYPTEAADWAEKQGMQPIWFKRFWRAHWNLPGLVQVREMFNRGIISDAQLEIYLRAADIPRFWRESLTKWFKSEVTRVDVRRIFSLGLIAPEDVFDRYLRLGYNAEDAGLMTQWTVAEYLDPDRQLTKSDILGMYQDGLLNETEATTYLTALDFSAEIILLLLAQQDLKRQAKFEGQIIANVRKLYIAGIYDRTDVYTDLGKLDTPATFIEQSLDLWDLDIKAKVTIPTTAQLRDMAQEGIISEERFRSEMGKRGYVGEYVDWYVKLWLR